MSGNEIKLASQCLIFFIKSLPKDCYFNVVCFGSRFKVLFQNPVLYTNENAMKLALSLSANMGGTILRKSIIICLFIIIIKAKQTSTNFRFD